MASIIYRGLDPSSGEPLFGQGQGNFISDLDAVAQAIATRLKLFTGEWWENLNTGTPVFDSMLGVSGSGRNPDAVALVLKNRILATPFVSGVSDISTSYDGTARAFVFSCSVQTQFGSLSITSTAPGANASNLG